MRRRTWTPYTNSRPLPRRPREDEGVARSRQRLQLCNCGHARRRQVSFCLCSLMRVILKLLKFLAPRCFFYLCQFIRELSILSRMKWVHQIPCLSHPPDRENRVPHEAVPVGFVVKYPALKCSRNSDGFIQRSDSFFILGGLLEEGFSIRRYELLIVYSSEGASIYDVHAKGGRGVSGKADEGRELSKGGCVNLQTRGEGVKKSENFADVICTCPLRG